MQPQIKITSKVPSLRFSGFEKEWEEKKLGEVSDFHDGERIPLEKSERQKRDGVYPYYGASGIIDYIDAYIFDGEYILLGEDGANIIDRSSRLSFIAKGKFWVNNHAHVLEAKENSYFLAEYLELLRYDKYNTGTAQPKLNAQICKKIKINLPSLPEQQKIASFLTSVDAWIENLRQQKSQLESYKKGMMQKLFSQEIRFKDDNGNEFSEWEEKKLGECLDYEQPNKYIVESTEYDNSYITPVLTAGKSFILGYTNEVNGIFSGCLPVIIFDDFTTTSQYVTFAFKVKSSAMKILIAKDNISIKFIFESMQQIKYEVGGHGRHWISVYSKMAIALPSFPEQQKIADFLSSIDNLLDSKQEQITKAALWKKGLMQQLFV